MIQLNSGYISGHAVETRIPPYPIYWWNSPKVCPVHEVNGYRPSISFDTRYAPDSDTNVSCSIDTSNKYYDGSDIGCTAMDITDQMPWGYNYEEHDYDWYWLRNVIPLYDENEDESSQYRILVEFSCAYMEPYVDENNPGYYWTSSQMRLTDRINQETVLGNFVDAEGIFKPENNHIYSFAGADTFYYHDRWGDGSILGSKSNILYSGNIIDACHYYGYSRVKWAGVSMNLDWIRTNLGVHLGKDWYNPH